MYQTRKVKVGNITIGGDAPVVVQSMTTTDTLDVAATAAEAIRIFEAGAQLVRITTQGTKEAKALEAIRQMIAQAGYEFPLSADIHFNPRAAYVAAELVEKVRINPGNFVKEKEESFEEGLLRIKEKLLPLLDLLRKHQTALRIGVNHGSLSERITQQYGDTPQGIVASCLEYLEICRAENFHDIIISIKSSNTVVMVKAVRLLVRKMQEQNLCYPLHLGVTEAGEGEDGRIKSAVGIGTLLNQGIGDTIRVSLTENPEIEPPVAQKLIDFTQKGELGSSLQTEFSKRQTHNVLGIGGESTALVVSDIRGEELTSPLLRKLGFGEQGKEIRGVDFILTDNLQTPLPQGLSALVPVKQYQPKDNHFPLYRLSELDDQYPCQFVECHSQELTAENIEKLKSYKQLVLLVEVDGTNCFHSLQKNFDTLKQLQVQCPVVVKLTGNELRLEDFQLKAAANLGGFFIDNLANGICLVNEQLAEEAVRETAFGILQATRVRTTKTEFISCPSCGRTLFDLQEVTARIKQHFNHLNHLKIAVMGCIVNGPGEMGDAHYGYVGAAKGKITLYKSHKVMKTNIPAESAMEELRKLIQEHGDWIDPITP